jgi:hypothetical protein
VRKEPVSGRLETLCKILAVRFVLMRLRIFSRLEIRFDSKKKSAAYLEIGALVIGALPPRSQTLKTELMSTFARESAEKEKKYACYNSITFQQKIARINSKFGSISIPSHVVAGSGTIQRHVTFRTHRRRCFDEIDRGLVICALQMPLLELQHEQK